MNKLLQRIEILTQRERLILIFTILVCLWGIWDKSVYQYLNQKLDKAENELKTVNNQIQTLQTKVGQIITASKNNPDLINRNKINQLDQQIRQQKTQLTEQQKTFVPAEKMADVLGEIMTEHNVRLIEIKTLETSGLPDSPNQTPVIYKHGIEMTLRADYFETLAYLQHLESLPWRIYWGDLSYQVKEYPEAETRLTLYTLSFDETWLGF